MIHTTKLYPTQDATSFHVLGRIMSGTLLANQEVRILGENYSLQDEEDSRFGQVGRLWISEARYWVKIKFMDEVCSAFKTIKKTTCMYLKFYIKLYFFTRLKKSFGAIRLMCLHFNQYLI